MSLCWVQSNGFDGDKSQIVRVAKFLNKTKFKTPKTQLKTPNPRIKINPKIPISKPFLIGWLQWNLCSALGFDGWWLHKVGTETVAWGVALVGGKHGWRQADTTLVKSIKEPITWFFQNPKLLPSLFNLVTKATNGFKIKKLGLVWWFKKCALLAIVLVFICEWDCHRDKQGFNH